MSHDNSFLLNEFVAKLLGNAAALPFTVPMYALGGAMKATGSTVSQGVKSTGEVATATRRAATDTVGLTKTEAAKKAEAEAKIEKERAEIETQKLKDAETPEKPQNMKKSITPLNAHLNQGSFDSFLYEVLSEASQASLNRKIGSSNPNITDGDKANAQKQLDLKTASSARRGENSEGKKNYEASRLNGSNRRKTTASQGKETDMSVLNQAKTKKKDTGPSRLAKFGGAVASKAKEVVGHTRAKRMKSTDAYKTGRDAHRDEQAKSYAGTQKTPGVLGFRKTRAQRTGAMKGKEEGQQAVAQMNAKRDTIEGGRLRRMARRVTPGGRARFQDKLARYGQQGAGVKQQQPTGINPNTEKAEKESVLNKRVSLGDCQRGSLDLLV